MILTVTPNPCVDKTVFIDLLRPGAKIRSRRYSCIAGGKGCNVSRAVKAMGGQTCALVVVGGPTGQHVVTMLERDDGIPCYPVWVDGMTRTITTVLEEDLHRQTAFFEPGPFVSPSEYAAIIEGFKSAVREAVLVTFNGSAPDSSLDMLYRELLLICRDLNIPVILDAYGPIFANAVREAPYMVKPNLEELEQFVGESLSTRDAQWRALDELRQTGITLVVLSLGSEGALLASESGDFQVQPPTIHEINAVGSGDALVAGFALGLMQEFDVEQTARLGVAMGTANAMTWDIGTFTPQQVYDILPRVKIVPR